MKKLAWITAALLAGYVPAFATPLGDLTPTDDVVAASDLAAASAGLTNRIDAASGAGSNNVANVAAVLSNHVEAVVSGSGTHWRVEWNTDISASGDVWRVQWEAGDEAHSNRTDNPHQVTAEQVGALTNEQDLAALRTHHYGNLNIVESPTNWFIFDGAGTITGFYYEAGRENVVIPWSIGGVAVTKVSDGIFAASSVTNLRAPRTLLNLEMSALAYSSLLASISLPAVTNIGHYVFDSCEALVSVSVPEVVNVGISAFANCSALQTVALPKVAIIQDNAFEYCSALASVTLSGNAPTVGTNPFFDSIPTIYVTDPTATGYGATLGGRPVVRLPLFTDSMTLGGTSRTNWTTDVDKHNTNESAHADIRAEVATNAFNIAAFPTNQAYAGVMAWDTGDRK
ncbi:MAG: leucine-rich repeat domain-containing protein, partial [Kiritimatiellae bacterium]|nr:leucine-rich repeat domain-containing protein [Kiritimatiellia bacterium]